MKVKQGNARVIGAIFVLLASAALVGCRGLGQNATTSDVQEAVAQGPAQLPQTDVMTVSTDRGDLYYPDEWEGLVAITQEPEGNKLVVTFTTNVNETTFGLFKVYIDGDENDGFDAGALVDASGKKHPVYIQVDDHSNLEGLDEGTKDRIYAMSDGVNTLIEHLGE